MRLNKYECNFPALISSLSHSRTMKTSQFFRTSDSCIIISADWQRTCLRDPIWFFKYFLLCERQINEKRLGAFLISFKKLFVAFHLGLANNTCPLAESPLSSSSSPLPTECTSVDSQLLQPPADRAGFPFLLL